MVKIKVNVIPGLCAICGAKGDTVLADCHVLYKGEWITQIERVCPVHVASVVKVEKPVKAEPKHEKKSELKTEKKPENKIVVRSDTEMEVTVETPKKADTKADSVFYAGKHPKK